MYQPSVAIGPRNNHGHSVWNGVYILKGTNLSAANCGELRV